MFARLVAVTVSLAAGAGGALLLARTDAVAADAPSAAATANAQIIQVLLGMI